MFTGIVLEVGRVVAAPAAAGGGRRLRVAHTPALGERLEIGASLAVAGVCLTVVGRELAESTVELSPETLRRTRLGELRRGARINLEPALRLGDALGGHWVQGHVDGTTHLLARHDRQRFAELWFALPAELARYVVAKGSIALDGVSLTVAERRSDRFSVAAIPHTLAVTTLGELRPGGRVHFEIDVLAKYVEALLGDRRPARPSPP